MNLVFLCLLFVVQWGRHIVITVIEMVGEWALVMALAGWLAYRLPALLSAFKVLKQLGGALTNGRRGIRPQRTKAGGPRS